MRKTRKTEAQALLRLKFLKKDLEDTQRLLLLAQKREVLLKELLQVDALVFEKKCHVRDIRLRLGLPPLAEHEMVQELNIQMSPPAPSTKVPFGCCRIFSHRLMARAVGQIHDSYQSAVC